MASGCWRPTKADKWGSRCLASKREATYKRAQHQPGLDPLVEALEPQTTQAAILEEPPGQLPGGVIDHDPAGRRPGDESSGQVNDRADHRLALARRLLLEIAGDNGARRNAYAQVEHSTSCRAGAAHVFHQREHCVQRRLRRILTGLRVTEQDEGAVAVELNDVSGMRRNDIRHDLPEFLEYPAQIIDIEADRQARRLHQIAEQDGARSQLDCTIERLRRLVRHQARPAVVAVSRAVAVVFSTSSGMSPALRFSAGARFF